jgi:DNA-binding NarL/FixJ family response regulator
LSSSKSTAPVAILNSDDEVIAALRVGLEDAGFVTVAARVADIQNGTLDLVAFIEAHDPQVIVYDLPRPYESHWNFLRLMRETDSLKNRIWILVTMDQKAVVAAVGGSRVIEIIVGRPYGVADVVEAVQLALD